MRTFLFILLGTVLLSSCDKIVADDITAETPVLILPTVDDTVGVNPVHFKWEAMEGATKYHLEIVSPSFDAIEAFALDSVISGTDFYFALDSNEYELKLTALNGGYESQVLGPIKFWVGVSSSSGGTGNSSVILTSPADQAYENAQFNNQFSWSPVSSATSYEFSLRQGTSFETGLVVNNQNNVSTPTYLVPGGALLEGEYFWGVKAYVNGVESPFAVHQLFIDTTDPNDAILGVPMDLSLVTAGTINFAWNSGSDPGSINSPVTSILEISTDAGFSTLVANTPINVIGNSTTVSLTGSGVYYWRVTNQDAAGNVSIPSDYYQFTLN